MRNFSHLQAFMLPRTTFPMNSVFTSIIPWLVTLYHSDIVLLPFDGGSIRFRGGRPSLSDEDVAADVLDSGFMEFGSFHYDLVPIKPVKPEIEGSAIKIGEITCFLAAFNTFDNLGCNTSNQNNNRGSSVCNTLMVQDPAFKILCLPLQDPLQRLSPPRKLGLVDFHTSVARFVDSVFLPPDLVYFPCFQFEELVPVATMPAPEKMNDRANLISASIATFDYTVFDPGRTLTAISNPSVSHLGDYRSPWCELGKLPPTIVMPPSENTVECIVSATYQQSSTFAFGPGENRRRSPSLTVAHIAHHHISEILLLLYSFSSPTVVTEPPSFESFFSLSYLTVTRR